MNILAIYRITYFDHNISQIKNLISYEEFINGYKPLKNEISEIESQLSELNKKSHKETISKLKKEKSILEKELKEKYGNSIFVVNSPLYNAIETGILELPKTQGGKHNIKIEKLK